MSNIQVTKHTRKPTTRPTTPIAPPEQMPDDAHEEVEMMDAGEETTAEVETAPTTKRVRPTRERAWFAMTHDEETSEAKLMEFRKKTDIKNWLAEKPGRTLWSDFLVWGWKQPIQTVQTVRF